MTGGHMGERIQMLVTVKAYPNPSVKYVESSCVAGIRTDVSPPEWIRLYPVPFRDLETDKQFKKYQFVNLEVTSGSDVRPESLSPNNDSIQLGDWVNTKRAWAERRRYVDPLLVDSLCWIKRQEKLDGTSLGVFRPDEIVDFTWKETVQPEVSQAASDQSSLLTPWKSPLEQPKYIFRYRFRCAEPHCPTHHITLVDWEVQQAFRRNRAHYGEAEGLVKLKEKFFGEMCGPGKDTMFYVGNMFQRHNIFMILGVFWPPTPTGG